MDRALMADSQWQALGRLIRERRLGLGLTLVELAAAVGLSQPFLSQIENGRARLSMSSLYRIASALHTTPQALFGAGSTAPGTTPEVVRADQADGIAVSGANLGGAASAALCRVLLPGTAAFHVLEFIGLPEEFDTYWEHDGFEALYVIVGPVEIDIAGARTTLHAGDFMSYDARSPHRLRSSCGDVRVLMIETPGSSAPAQVHTADHALTRG